MTATRQTDYGTLTPVPGGRALRFERQLPHPIEAVWAALTDPAELPLWLAPSDIDLYVGGRASIRFVGGDAVDGRVTAVAAPRLLEYTWLENGKDCGTVRWELTRNGNGTTLVLLHTLPGAVADQLGFAGGWHAHLELLGAALNGAPQPYNPNRWRELRADYESMYPTGPIPGRHSEVTR